MITINDVLPKLRGVKRTNPGHWMARCPAHDDKSPSLSVSEVAGGRILLHCFTGCSFESLTAALGINRFESKAPRAVTPIRKAIEDKPLDADPMWRRWFDSTSYQVLDGLGVSLGVDTDCLKAIGCAWSTYSAWAFPMRDATEKVIGIRLRNDEGHKWAVKGSKSGLFIPSDYSWVPDGVCYLVEGPTDLAAAMTIGLRAIGRAACLGQEELILQWLSRNHIERLVIVTDNDEPGLRGAEKLQSMLSILSCVWVPPTKDIREFVNLGGNYTTMKACAKDLVWTRARRAA
ncbi:MAG TPA: toprim domain-containing protein [Polyangiaceae bacterium]|nr:toprim domain-containing protein [Polyangiaceae bacterium]